MPRANLATLAGHYTIDTILPWLQWELNGYTSLAVGVGSFRSVAPLLLLPPYLSLVAWRLWALRFLDLVLFLRATFRSEKKVAQSMQSTQVPRARAPAPAPEPTVAKATEA